VGGGTVTDVTLCPQSGRAPTREEWQRRNGAVLICEACGQRVELFVYRLDWSRPWHTYKAEHRTGLWTQ
jgi:hypothetical protein